MVFFKVRHTHDHSHNYRSALMLSQTVSHEKQMAELQNPLGLWEGILHAEIKLNFEDDDKLNGIYTRARLAAVCAGLDRSGQVWTGLQ